MHGPVCVNSRYIRVRAAGDTMYGGGAGVTAIHPSPRPVRHDILRADRAAVDVQAEGVRRARVDSRKVSAGGTLLVDLAQLSCRIRVLWGERDDSAFRPAARLIGEMREAVPALDVHRIPAAGHWSAYENAPEVNRRLLEFFTTVSP